MIPRGSILPWGISENHFANTLRPILCDSSHLPLAVHANECTVKEGTSRRVQPVNSLRG